MRAAGCEGLNAICAELPALVRGGNSVKARIRFLLQLGGAPSNMADYAQRVGRMLDRWAGVRVHSKRTSSPESGRNIVVRLLPSWYVSLALWLLQVAMELMRRLLGAEGPPRRASEFVIEPPRRTPCAASCDVLVVGGGPAGLSAAVAAARAGADVMLIERYGCFGGCITTVGMETLGWYRYEGVVEGDGIGLEMERLAARMGGTIKWPFNESECLDADYFKIVADELVRSSGVRPLLHALVADVLLESGRVVGVVIESKSGRQVSCPEPHAAPRAARLHTALSAHAV